MTLAACFISGGAAPGAALEALLAKETTLSLSSVELVCTQETASPSTKYNIVLAASSSAHSQDALARVARSMAPGGRLYVYEASPSGSSRLETLKKDLLLSGFVDATELSSSGSVWVGAQLPQWGLGAAAKLSLKRPAAPAAAAAAPAVTAAAPAKASVWKLGGDEDGEEEELVDDDALLAPEDKAAAAPKYPDDCEVGAGGARKACKNCSCGRAEAEAEAEAGGGKAKVALTADMLDNPTSACGNCYLGDAFRCGTCPYRGLPAFEPGQKISLAANLLAADV
ncbi:hypothetical protein HYH02_010119 [Chlamydomonas schloesseri]|uniref:Anamorsin homolog n=1 Tax=Chlamydomonas schloesseri TaxID=2026947 RepID=A0A835W6K0_9CHLO|nr:hypothetical protein HYH02_010119 [Chlamydomonas schloesseri]|eukprot:KAG2441280.1 hypothetical protein HYH02_010119 [Chlamydomonas schloesseri]